ncbi:hypothetical protein SAMN06298214_0633 [Bacteroidales bacterium WCE2004]|nr:hypothetical protein SAMN06298214_0633 [Bacteroidales bacterium WCE2004]
MNYRYRVTLAGIKGFYRVYLVNGDNSLYTFHKQLRSDLEFPMDQPILFKAMDAEGAVVARYALMDIGFGAVDNVTVADTVKAGVTSFVYFYDITSKKSVIITLEGETTEKVATPRLVESKGPIPLEFENGYVAFEDLPEERRRLPGESRRGKGDDDDEDDDDEDFEDDEDEEDEDKEDEELVYDEEEE